MLHMYTYYASVLCHMNESDYNAMHHLASRSGSLKIDLLHPPSISVKPSVQLQQPGGLKSQRHLAHPAPGMLGRINGWSLNAWDLKDIIIIKVDRAQYTSMLGIQYNFTDTSKFILIMIILSIIIITLIIT